MYLKDPKTGKKSVTLTLLVATFVIALIKVLASGVEFQDIKLGEFDGTQFAAMVGAVGAIYGFRKHSDREK